MYNSTSQYKFSCEIMIKMKLIEEYKIISSNDLEITASDYLKIILP